MTTEKDIRKYVEDRRKDTDFLPIYEIWMIDDPEKPFAYENGTISEDIPGSDVEYFGYYYELETASVALHENWTDLRETIYEAAFVICRFPGLTEPGIARIFFLWDEESQGFFEAEEPDLFKCVCY